MESVVNSQWSGSSSALYALTSLWLCHSDARHVSDLPVARHFFGVFDPFDAVIDRQSLSNIFGKS
jgi:hypothetical protein